ncbi:MAG: DNA repair protein RadA [Bacteroidales bacterium]|nr:DNA repair protein RadA [Bacteroidales bacterium]
MAKTKTVFFCQNCGQQSPKWVGKCPSCGSWNTFVEEIVRTDKKIGKTDVGTSTRRTPKLLSEIETSDEARIDTHDKELNRVLGGGLVTGSVVLVGGEPGIGKSTLMLQLALKLQNKRVLYVSGEESDQQIKMRAERLGKTEAGCLVLTETSMEDIFLQIENVKPGIIVIDSIQTLHTQMIDSSAGSISQIRECANQLQQYAKITNTPVFLVGHITKEGNIAGPKILEHIVDTVLYFEGDRNYGYRILRAVKNRFGSAHEIGIYEMRDTGLREVSNPSELLISQRDENLSGIAISATIEGLRPMLIETQALVSTAAYGVPQRSATGFDARRLNMLLAVLEKRAGFRLTHKDVFLNIAGGIRVDDPAIDLAVVCAVLSSNEDMPISPKACFAAEVGLSGEIRAVNRLEQRISEAQKLGFEKIFVSGYGFKKADTSKSTIQIIPVSRIEDVFKALFG